MKITRRDLALLAASSPATTLLPKSEAQTKSDAEVNAKRAENKAAAQVVARIELPMSTEPAFEFKA